MLLLALAAASVLATAAVGNDRNTDSSQSAAMPQREGNMRLVVLNRTAQSNSLPNKCLRAAGEWPSQDDGGVQVGNWTGAAAYGWDGHHWLSTKRSSVRHSVNTFAVLIKRPAHLSSEQADASSLGIRVWVSQTFRRISFPEEEACNFEGFNATGNGVAISGRGNLDFKLCGITSRDSITSDGWYVIICNEWTGQLLLQKPVISPQTGAAAPMIVEEMTILDTGRTVGLSISSRKSFVSLKVSTWQSSSANSSSCWNLNSTNQTSPLPPMVTATGDSDSDMHALILQLEKPVMLNIAGFAAWHFGDSGVQVGTSPSSFNFGNDHCSAAHIETAYKAAARNDPAKFGFQDCPVEYLPTSGFELALIRLKCPRLVQSILIRTSASSSNNSFRIDYVLGGFGLFKDAANKMVKISAVNSSCARVDLRAARSSIFTGLITVKCPVSNNAVTKMRSVVCCNLQPGFAHFFLGMAWTQKPSIEGVDVVGNFEKIAKYFAIPAKSD